MDKVECEKCPIYFKCNAYKEARRDNDMSYHPQDIIRVWSNYCPLIKLMGELQDKEEQ